MSSDFLEAAPPANLRLQGNLSSREVAAQTYDRLTGSRQLGEGSTGSHHRPQYRGTTALARSQNRLLHHPVDGHGILSIHRQDGEMLPLRETAHAGEVDCRLGTLPRTRSSPIGCIRTCEQQRQLRLLRPLECFHPTPFRTASTGERQDHAVAAGRLQSPRSRCTNR